MTAADAVQRGGADDGKREVADDGKRGVVDDGKRGATAKEGASMTNKHHHHLRDRSELRKKNILQGPVR